MHLICAPLLTKFYSCKKWVSVHVYISRDVIFDESVFPFSELNPNAGVQLKNEIMLLHPTLIPSFTPPENAIENHVNDSNIYVESFDETNVSTNPDEAFLACRIRWMQKIPVTDPRQIL
jgi:hypothetical protein